MVSSQGFTVISEAVTADLYRVQRLYLVSISVIQIETHTTWTLQSPASVSHKTVLPLKILYHNSSLVGCYQSEFIKGAKVQY